jgi:hypothetical protein
MAYNQVHAQHFNQIPIFLAVRGREEVALQFSDLIEIEFNIESHSRKKEGSYLNS